MTDQHFDVAVIGAGIVGIANAWMAAEKGNSVILIERDRVALGASVRNFGMVWPVGQPWGRPVDLGLRSRERWLQLAEEAKIWANTCGSIQLAHSEDEWAVLTEFIQPLRNNGLQLEALGVDQVCQRAPAVNTENLVGGIYSPTEVCVNSRVALEQATQWLVEKYGITYRPRTLVTRVEGETISTSGCETFTANRQVVCSGDDLQTLFPEILRNANIRRCKLQMMATAPQAKGWRVGPMLTSALTCRHYSAYKTCPSLPKLKKRLAETQPELDQYGIHVMVAQNDLGEIILGDSHLYDDDITPFHIERIDELILDEIKKLARIPDLKIERKWSGTYAKASEGAYFEYDIGNTTKLLTGFGGAGMTLAFGLAEEIWNNW